MTEKKSFLLYGDSFDEVSLLSIEQRGQLLTALFDYFNSGDILETDDIALAIVFSSMRRSIDRDAAKYAETCRRNAENGRKGGRPAKKPSGFDETERFSENPTKADNDRDTDIDHEIDIETDIETGTESDTDLLPFGNSLSSFVPPTVEQVENFADSIGEVIDAELFVAHYSSTGWLVGNKPMIDWKSAVKAWILREDKF